MYLIQSVCEVKLEGISEEGLALDDDCIIRPLTAEIRRVAEAMVPHIGIANLEEIVSAGLVNFLSQRSAKPIAEEEARRFLLRAIALTQQFLLSLWMVKDHSGNT